MSTPSRKPAPKVVRPFGRALRNALATYEKGLNRVVASGKITHDDAELVARVAADLGLNDKDTLPFRLIASKYLFDFEVRTRTWSLHDGALDSLPRLGLNGTTDPTLASAYHFNRATRLRQIFETTGVPEPLVSGPSTLIRDHGETEVLSLAAALYEERITGTIGFSTLSNRFTGDSNGMSEYGSSITSTSIKRNIVASSKGDIHLTDRRFVFTGTPKSQSFGWVRLNGIEPFNDGLNLYVEGQAETLILRLDRAEYRNYAHVLMLTYAHRVRQVG